MNGQFAVRLACTREYGPGQLGIRHKVPLGQSAQLRSGPYWFSTTSIRLHAYGIDRVGSTPLMRYAIVHAELDEETGATSPPALMFGLRCSRNRCILLLR